MRINIDVTNHCNKACSICPMKDRYTRDIFPLGYMDLKPYTDIINDLPQGTEIDFHKDGEPLMHPYIAWMIAYAKANLMFTHVVTNGLLLGKKKERIVESGLDLLTISAVDKIPVDSINEFMAYKGNRLPVTQLKVYGDLPANPETAALAKIDKVICRPLHNWTNDEKRNNSKPCSKLLNYLAVNWDGSWALCCVDYKREFSLFNIKEVPRRKWREITKKIYEWQEGGLFLAPCKTCNYWEE
jgi:radical SAM protein with 4Fe4S-binding SPASM domain